MARRVPPNIHAPPPGTTAANTPPGPAMSPARVMERGGPASVDPVLAGKRLIVCHSPHDKCGIYEYGMALDAELCKMVPVLATNRLSDVERHCKPGDMALFHFEPGVSHGIIDVLAALRRMGVKTVVCCHWYESGRVSGVAAMADRIAVHRRYDGVQPNAVEIPLACQMFEPVAREDIKESLGFKRDSLVVTTVGFMTRWKRWPEIVQAIFPELMRRPHAILQMITPWPYDLQGSYADVEDQAIRLLFTRTEGRQLARQFRYSNDFLPTAELLRRCAASDLGFVFHPVDTGSVSAATKQFVSVRCPVALTSTSHNADMQLGTHRIPTQDPQVFMRGVFTLADQTDWLGVLRQQMAAEYERLNMNAVARRYIECFKTLF